jgi:hypothetical protein
MDGIWMVENFMSSVFELIFPGMADHITDKDLAARHAEFIVRKAINFSG